MKISDLSQIKDKNKQLYYGNKKIEKWWGKTLCHYDSKTNILHTRTFNLFGLFFHCFGYKSEYQDNLRAWLKSKHIVIAKPSGPTKPAPPKEDAAVEDFRAACVNPDTELPPLLDRLDPNTRISDRTLLGFAASYKNSKLVELLLERGANPHASQGKDPTISFTPIQCAIAQERVENVRVFLKRVDYSEAQKNIFLDSAIYKGNVSIAELLLENGAAKSPYKKNESLIDAAVRGHWGLVKLFLKHGADINYSPHGRTVLDFACEENNHEMVKFLIEKGADIESKKDSLFTGAASRGHWDMVQLLLEYKPNVNAENNYNDTALLMAFRQQNLPMLELLVEKGAVIDYDNHFRYFIDPATRERKILQFFLKHGAARTIVKIDSKWNPEIIADIKNALMVYYTDLLKTPDLPIEKKNEFLTIAINCNHLELLKLLITNGANCQTEQKPLLLTLACEQRNLALVQYLIEQGAPIDFSGRPDTREGIDNLPIAVATDRRDVDIVRALLETNKITQFVKDALLFRAASFLSPHFELVQLFKDHGADDDKLEFLHPKWGLITTAKLIEKNKSLPK